MRNLRDRYRGHHRQPDVRLPGLHAPSGRHPARPLQRIHEPAAKEIAHDDGSAVIEFEVREAAGLFEALAKDEYTPLAPGPSVTVTRDATGPARFRSSSFHAETVAELDVMLAELQIARDRFAAEMGE